MEFDKIVYITVYWIRFCRFAVYLIMDLDVCKILMPYKEKKPMGYHVFSE